MTKPPSELTALHSKHDEIEAEIAENRDRINQMQTRNGVLAGMRSDCLKAIARMTIAKVPDCSTTLKISEGEP